MKALFFVLGLTALTVFSAGDSVAVADAQQACLLNATTVAQQQACCKANKGICGCRAGKIVCCDKTFADGCTCAREDEPPIS